MQNIRRRMNKINEEMKKSVRHVREMEKEIAEQTRKEGRAVPAGGLFMDALEQGNVSEVRHQFRSGLDPKSAKEVLDESLAGCSSEDEVTQRSTRFQEKLRNQEKTYQGSEATAPWLVQEFKDQAIARDLKKWRQKKHQYNEIRNIVAAAFQIEQDKLLAAALPKAMQRSLNGLVGLEKLITYLAHDLSDFANANESRGRLLWGPSGCGKTELAQRLSGLRDGIPPLQYGNGTVAYISGVDGKLDLKSIVDQLPPKSILFVDEADKCLDSAAQMVSQSEAVQLHHAIVTHFARKPIYWAFLGTFSAMRSNNKINYQMLEKTVGPELASRLDFLDWEFPAWTTETLLLAVKPLLNKRGLVYDDEAIVLLVAYCLKGGGGVRAFDNLDQSLKRRLSTVSNPSGDARVTRKVAADFLGELGFKATA